jgi:hypothetical protein
MADEHKMASIHITVAIPCLIVKFNAKVLLPLKLSMNTLDAIDTKNLRSNCDENHQNDSVVTKPRRHRLVKRIETSAIQNSSSCQMSEITVKDVDISDNDDYSRSTGSSSLSITSHSSTESNSDNEDDVSDSGHESDFSDMSELTNLNCDESDFF